MPNPDVAIIDPFSPLRADQAFLVAVCGIVVVFLMLLILALLILAVSRAVMILDRPSPAPEQTTASPEDDAELAAVIMAVIAAETDQDPAALRLHTVTPLPPAAPRRAAGRLG